MTTDIKTPDKIREHELLSQIKALIDDKIVLSSSSDKFYGRLIFGFRAGKFVYMEKNETLEVENKKI